MHTTLLLLMQDIFTLFNTNDFSHQGESCTLFSGLTHSAAMHSQLRCRPTLSFYSVY
jgi:hypothetical protein